MHSKANPNGEHIERTHKGVVSFAWLKWLVIGINYNGNTSEEEEEQYGPSILPISFKVEVHSNEAQNERKQEVAVVGFIALKVAREIRLRS